MLETSVVIQIIIGGIVAWFGWFIKQSITRNIKLSDQRIKEYVDATEKKFDIISNSISKLFESIHEIKDGLTDRVNNNMLESERLNTKIEKLETRVDNLEKIIDRRGKT